MKTGFLSGRELEVHTGRRKAYGKNWAQGFGPARRVTSPTDGQGRRLRPDKKLEAIR